MLHTRQTATAAPWRRKISAVHQNDDHFRHLNFKMWFTYPFWQWKYICRLGACLTLSEGWSEVRNLKSEKNSKIAKESKTDTKINKGQHLMFVGQTVKRRTGNYAALTRAICVFAKAYVGFIGFTQLLLFTFSFLLSTSLGPRCCLSTVRAFSLRLSIIRCSWRANLHSWWHYGDENCAFWHRYHSVHTIELCVTLSVRRWFRKFKKNKIVLRCPHVWSVRDWDKNWKVARCEFVTKWKGKKW